jgi:hypothetical protein
MGLMEIEMATAKRKSVAAEPKEVAVEETVSTGSTEKPVRQRRNRGAFNGTRGKLQVGHQIPGYHLYFFNDEPGRIQAALDAGWEFVSPEEVGYASSNVTNRNTDLGSGRVSVVGGKNDQGHPQQQVLLKIRQDWWEEDQAEIQRRNDKTDASIRKGKVGDIDSTGFYDAGIKY